MKCIKSKRRVTEITFVAKKQADPTPSAQKTSQRKFANMLLLQGLDFDKNAIQIIESGQRFVTDIELKVIAGVLNASYEELLGTPGSD